MKKLIAILLILFLTTSSAFAGLVKGYYRKDGTYVSPHFRRPNPYSKARAYKNLPPPPKTIQNKPRKNSMDF